MGRWRDVAGRGRAAVIPKNQFKERVGVMTKSSGCVAVWQLGCFHSRPGGKWRSVGAVTYWAASGFYSNVYTCRRYCAATLCVD